MLTKRIIPCLDIKEGRVVKGVNFVNFKDAGDPIELAKIYNKEGADEISFLDITASYEKRKTLIELVRKTADQIFIPLSVGGGIKRVEDIRKLINAGAEKVSIGSYAVKKPEFVKKAVEKFGSQAIVLSIDAKKNNDTWEVYILGGRKSTCIDALKFAKKMEKIGVGEILLNSIDRDGTNKGFDIELNKIFSESLNIPIIASGGAGDSNDIYKVLTKGKADAALAASIFHYRKYTINEIKKYLKQKGVSIRL